MSLRLELVLALLLVLVQALTFSVGTSVTDVLFNPPADGEKQSLS